MEQRIPRPFSVGSREVEILQQLADWPSDGVRKIGFANDPGWIGFVRKDGSGLALHEPNHLELLNLRLTVAKATADAENYYWGV